MNISTIPSVSIIIPVYNVEKYLERCLDSVLAQTFADYECILVDDASPDNCPEICDAYAVKDKRFKVIHEAFGSGVSKARNDGFDASTGAYIFFIDSDDFISADAIELLYGFAVKNDLDMAEGGFSFFYETGKAIEKFVGNTQIIKGTCDISNFYFSACDWFVVWNKLIKKEILLKNRIRFCEGTVFEDCIYIQRDLLPVLKTFGFMNKTTYFYYRNNRASITKNTSQLQIQSMLFVVYTLLNDDFVYTHSMESRNYCLYSLLTSAVRQLCFLKLDSDTKKIYIQQFRKILISDRFENYLKNHSIKQKWKILFFLLQSRNMYVCFVFLKMSQIYLIPVEALRSAFKMITGTLRG